MRQVSLLPLNTAAIARHTNINTTAQGTPLDPHEQHEAREEGAGGATGGGNINSERIERITQSLEAFSYAYIHTTPNSTHTQSTTPVTWPSITLSSTAWSCRTTSHPTSSATCRTSTTRTH